MKNIRDIDFNELLENNKGLIMELVIKIQSRAKTGLSDDELFWVGALGMYDAQLRFSEDLNYEFSTYATQYIKGYITNAIRDEKRSQAGLNKCQFNKSIKIERILKEKEKNGWSWEETRIKSELPKEDWDEYLFWYNCGKIKSLNYKVRIGKNAARNTEVLDLLAVDDNSTEKSVVFENLIEFLYSKLNNVEKEILKYRFVKGLSPIETYTILNIKQSTFQYREKRLIEKIKKILIKEQIPAA
ncbi:sigma-70 family RNA polymerase sigma factor [Priestia aryabhattai]